MTAKKTYYNRRAISPIVFSDWIAGWREGGGEGGEDEGTDGRPTWNHGEGIHCGFMRQQ